MGVIVSAFPSVPSTIQTVTLGEQQYRLRLTWRRRLQGWYMDLYTLAGDPLALGRRLSPGWSPLLGIVLDEETAPDGHFVVRGLDDYLREDLGEGLTLAFYTTEELEAAQAAAEAAAAADRDGEPDPESVTVTFP